MSQRTITLCRPDFEAILLSLNPWERFVDEDLADKGVEHVVLMSTYLDLLLLVQP